MSFSSHFPISVILTAKHAIKQEATVVFNVIKTNYGLIVVYVVVVIPTVYANAENHVMVVYQVINSTLSHQFNVYQLALKVFT